MEKTFPDLITEFNSYGRLGTLVQMFTFDLQDSGAIRIASDSLNREKLEDLRFSLIKVADDQIIYVDATGEIASANTSESGLRSVLSEIKSSEKNIPHDNHDNAQQLRTLLLMAGKGSLKSHDVYTDTDRGWTKQRQRLHWNIVNACLKDARTLSKMLDQSDKLGRGLYCMRGTVASGKTTFAQNYLRNNVLGSKEVPGVINTDNIKRSLIEASGDAQGHSLPMYLVHDEASMINKRVLACIKDENLSYFIDSRMQDESDLDGLLTDADTR